MNNKNTKGLSLIEVAVSLSILTMVFASVITLIVNVVNLNLLARQKTEAISFAQDGLATGVQKSESRCPVYIPPTAISQAPAGSPLNARYFRVVYYEKGNMEWGGASYQFNPTATNYSYVKITSLVEWLGRGDLPGTLPTITPANFPQATSLITGANRYSVSQIVRVGNE